ncbi:MAG: hypothetical protein V1747_03675 [Candidatus Omnitrophota bacterium]
MNKKKIFSRINKLLISLFIFSNISLLCAFAEKARTVFIPEIKAEVDKTTVNIGEIIHYTVSFKVPAEAELKFLEAKDNQTLGAFDIRNLKEKKAITQDKADQIIRNYELTIFQTGEQVIPEYSLEYRLNNDTNWQKITAQSINVTVASVLEKEAKDLSPKPLKPKLIIWRDFWGWVIGLIVLAVIALIIFFVKKQMTKLKTKPVVIIPAHVIALAELEKLQEQDLVVKGLMEQYFEQLSGCMRRYLENRFQLRAPWLSTEEFLIKAKTSPVLTTEQKHLLQAFLILSDLVKFARYGSTAAEAQDSFRSVRNFIEQTKQVEADNKQEAIK